MATLLSKLKINEVSLVKSPANKGARALLVKADASVKPVPKKPVKARKDDGDAETYEDIRTEQTIRRAIWDGMDALRESVCSILADETVTNPAEMISTSVNQFRDDIVAQVGKSERVQTALDEIWGAVSKTLPGMEKQTMPKTTAELEAELAKANGERDEAIALSKMSDDEKAHMADMPADKKKAFMAMDAEGRKKAMKKADESKAQDEILKVGATEIRKSAVGEHVFAAMKAQQDQNAELLTSLSKAEEERRVDSITKSLTDGGVPAEIAKARAPSLRKLQVQDADAAAEIIKDMVAAVAQKAEADKVLTTSIGSGQRQAPGGAYDQIAAKGEELRKADPKLTQAQAFTKAYQDPANAQLVSLYKAERASAQ